MILQPLRKCLPLLVCLLAPILAHSQKVITYEAGMGTRDPEDPDVWILYQKVKAMHEGMVLHADSALLNTELNDFTAYGNVKIEISDTTTIFGDRLFYDGTARVLDIWAAPRPGDSVILVDGKTVLKTPHLLYDRNTSTASYNNGALAVNGSRRLVSREGDYNSDTKIFYIYREVELSDTNMRLLTDTLVYNMNTREADFWSPTHIFSDSATIYSESGSYNTDSRYAFSSQASHVQNGEKTIDCDTLHYYEATEFGRAIGHVVLVDTVNRITSYSGYAETDQPNRTSFVTDSAVVCFVSKPEAGDTLARPDTLFLHADSILVANDSVRQLASIRASHHVKAYRKDFQLMCDSAYYSRPDSLLKLFQTPVVWYESYQCTADTILLWHNDDGAREVAMRTKSFCIQQIDSLKFNQIYGNNCLMAFAEGEPVSADFNGNAQMVYYVTENEETDSAAVIAANVGKGSEIMVFLANRELSRVATIGKPEMDAVPAGDLKEDKSRLPGFKWMDNRRPRRPEDIFKW